MEVSLSFVLFGTFLLLLATGTPIAVALGSSAIAASFYLGENPIKMVQIAFNSVGSFPLIALPSFILAGSLMEAAGISKRLVNIAESLSGSFTGGISASTVLACLLFGAISGSGPATTAAVGMLMIPAMVKHGYKKDYAAAITASSGGLGIIIPPSIPMVIYGISALGTAIPKQAIANFGEFQSVSITKMFIAGVIPGLIISTSLLLLNYYSCKKAKIKGTGNDFSFSLVKKALVEGKWAICAPLVILGGIYSGLFTPTESAVVAIFYTLFIGVFVHKEIKLKAFFSSLDSTSKLTGRILLILFCATSFGRILVENQISETLANNLLGLTSNIYLVWILLIALLLFIGMFMETLAAIMILTPVLLPITYLLGIDPIHFGTVLVCALSIGFSTPPLGENLFVASAISGVSFERITAKAIPFVAISVLAVIIIAFIPFLSLKLPSLLGY